MTWNDAYAQVGGPAGPDNAFLAQVLQFLPLILMFVIIYFLMIRPQQQRAKETARMLSALKKGDRVVTTGGIVGTVVGLDENRTMLRIADDVRVEFLKSAITQVLAEGSK